MAPMGFEPTTPALRARYSDQAELRGHIKDLKNPYLTVVILDIFH